MTRIDRTGLAAYCDNFDRWIIASEVLKQSPMAAETMNGSLMQNPHLGILNRAQDKCLRFMAKFGMSPADRAMIPASSVVPLEDRGKAEAKTSARGKTVGNTVVGFSE